jgi:hypothetical protein
LARPESLLRAFDGSVAPEFAYADVTGREVRERHLVAGELWELHINAESAVDLLEGSPALQRGSYQRASHDQEAVAGFAGQVPARQRCAGWSPDTWWCLRPSTR